MKADDRYHTFQVLERNEDTREFHAYLDGVQLRNLLAYGIESGEDGLPVLTLKMHVNVGNHSLDLAPTEMEMVQAGEDRKGI